MRERARIVIRGAVQGVGFRPFVHRLALEMALDGWVVNGTAGVIIEVDGEREVLGRFRDRLMVEKPSIAVISDTELSWLEAAGYNGFRIESSDESGAKTVPALPDMATCEMCLVELFDPADRRFRYPFLNCTLCGPRFSIIRSLPYDRSRTTMDGFTMCAACRREYEDPGDRRFHAQPDACADCGPQLALWSSSGEETAKGEDALDGALKVLDRGEILAVKGLGGFLIMVDAGDGAAVRRLRKRKSRRDKPFAVMVRDLDAAQAICRLDRDEAALLASPQAPIVLLERREGAAVHHRVAPGNPYLGVMLAYTPLYHLLTTAFGRPLVATSGNLRDEPICKDESDAIHRLESIADRFLVHDRPIERHLDDSVALVFKGEPRIMRRARGYSPAPVFLDSESPSILAVGPHLKNTIALNIGRQVFMSQHIGDMENPETMEAFKYAISDFLRLYGVEPIAIAHDLHPGYLSTQWAVEVSSSHPSDRFECLQGLPLVAVQHHHAHMASCLVENSCRDSALGVTWDGTGHGTDDTVWGGEFLVGDTGSFSRAACFLPFRLPGGEAAIREPRRSALSLLWEVLGEDAIDREDLAPIRSFGSRERRLIAAMLRRGVNTPVTTSAGRLFDGVAAMIGLNQTVTFEGHAAMALEFIADRAVRDAYPVDMIPSEGCSDCHSGPRIVDWRPMLEAILADLEKGVARSVISTRFHNALADSILMVASHVGEERVALTGGCFQNRLLLERAQGKLQAAGFKVLLHRQVPPNDGGVSLGQVAAAAAYLVKNTTGG